MGDLDKNIHRKNESSPYEKIIVNPIEKDRREKEKGFESFKNASKASVFAALLSHLKKIIAIFGANGKHPGLFKDQQHLLVTIAAFRELLLILTKEDLSHYPDFTEKLTELWHNLLDDCNSLAPSEAVPSEIVEKLKFFISQVEHFPPGADHTLGFYFNAYAGKDWIPFPFMQLLQGLHEEYQASPPISVLQNWILLLNGILTSAGIELE
jgi:hypothetical protein